MAKSYIHYKTCTIASSYPKLVIEYILSDPNDFSHLRQDIENGVSEYESNHSPEKLDCRCTQDPQNPCMVTATITRQRSPLDQGSVINLSHALASFGALNAADRSALEQNAKNVAISSPATSASNSSAPAASPPAPAAPMASPPAAGMSLKPHYFSCLPNKVASGAILLHYVLNGPYFSRGTTVNQQIMRDHTVLLAALTQTITDYNIKNSTQIQAVPTTLSVSNTLRAEFELALTQPPGNSPLDPQHLLGVADALEHAGCITPKEAGALKALAAPAPQVSAATAALVPQLTRADVPLLQNCWHHAPSIGVNTTSGKQTLAITYHLSGTQQTIQNDMPKLYTAITNAASSVNVPRGVRIVPSFGAVRVNSSYSMSGTGHTISFDVEFERFLAGSRQNITEQDMRGLATELEREKCTSAQGLSMIHQGISAAAGQAGFARGP